MDQRCLMAVFAHPDDEVFSTGGVYRKYRDQGVRTALVCATRGEVGEISDPALATPATLGQVREGELRESARILGIDEVRFLDYRDGQVAAADEVEAVGRIVREIRALRPQVVVTFDPKGVYGHPDHIAVHRLTLSAFAKAGDVTCYPEHFAQGLAPHAPQKLYLTAAAVSVFRAMSEAMQAEGLSFAPGGNAATIALEQMGTPDEEITTIVPLDDHQFEAKMAALRAHRTQIPADSLFNRLSDEVMRMWRGTERFVRIFPPFPIGGAIESDLFAAD